MSNIERSEFYGALQRIVDALFEDAESEVPAAESTEASAAASAASAASAADAVPTTAERLGVSSRTASLLGLSAFDAPASASGAAGAGAVAVSGESGSAPAAAVAAAPTVRRLDVVVAAESADLPDELMRVVTLLPPGSYTRQRLCDQLNSAITGHAWGQVYGTVS